MKTIAKAQYYQLIGLLEVAKQHNQALKLITQSALEITDERDSRGELDDIGHTSDAIYCGEDIKYLLNKLKIKVK